MRVVTKPDQKNARHSAFSLYSTLSRLNQIPSSLRGRLGAVALKEALAGELISGETTLRGNHCRLCLFFFFRFSFTQLRNFMLRVVLIPQSGNSPCALHAVFR